MPLLWWDRAMDKLIERCRDWNSEIGLDEIGDKLKGRITGFSLQCLCWLERDRVMQGWFTFVRTGFIENIQKLSKRGSEFQVVDLDEFTGKLVFLSALWRRKAQFQTGFQATALTMASPLNEWCQFGWEPSTLKSEALVRNLYLYLMLI